MHDETPGIVPDLLFKFAPAGRAGKGALTVKADDQAIFVDTMTITNEADRARVVTELTTKYPALDPEEVASKLLDLAEETTRKATRPKATGGPATSDPSAMYPVVDGCICHDVPNMFGSVQLPLCNFNAWIIEEVVHDDGVEQSRRLMVEGTLASGGPLAPVEVTTEEFTRGDWPISRWGTEAVVHAGKGTKDHLRAALQLRSGRVPKRVIYTFTGWCPIGGAWGYLHAGGAIGPDGPMEGISVVLPDALARYRLPDPPEGDERVAAIRASLDLLRGLAPDEVIFPLLATTFRVVLRGSDFSTQAAGRTGSGKTELAALMQQHFGPEMNAKNLPANWSSTANALEALAFAAKDALLVVDDFCPTGSQADMARLHREADRLIRAQGNHSGRQRLRADSSLKLAKPPRGLIFITGEDVPRGHSLRARLLVVEVGPDDVNFGRLGEYQRAAAEGRYAQAMAAYLRWLAPQFERVGARLKIEVGRLRDEIASGLDGDRHRRTPTLVADLLAGFELFLGFAFEVGAITGEEADDLRGRCRRAVVKVAIEQANHHGSSDPCERYMSLLKSVLSSGRAYVAGLDGDCPGGSPQPWGWRHREGLENSGGTWQPLGNCIGWLDGEDLYLDPDAAYTEVQRMADAQGEPITVNPETLHKRMSERHMLASVDSGRGRIKVRRMIAGSRRPVLHLHAARVLGANSGGPNGPSGPDDEEERGNGPPDWAVPGSSRENRPTAAAQNHGECLPFGPDGPDGPPQPTAHSPGQNNGEDPKEVAEF